MLSREDNERITRVGRDTPMGAVMRRYWMPVCMTSELNAPDGEPLRITLLGEQLVAYRDTTGKVGLLNEFCPHRRASLWLGRNEEAGLRCVFHGWKFDTTGACVDMPTEPAETNFAHKVSVQAYPTVELGDLVWAYMGPPDKQPPLPKFEFTTVPASHRYLSKTIEECNWLQALEGGVDSAHSSYLHRALGNTVARGGFSANGYRGRGGRPKLDVRLAPWGYTYASIRELGDEGDFTRSYQYVMPFTQIRARQLIGVSGELRPEDRTQSVSGHFWVPMDDETTMVYNWTYSFGEEPLAEGAAMDRNSGRGEEDQLPNFRKVRNKANNWLIDRQVQKTLTFSGIEGINTQDHAVQESMGPIADRTGEHLGTIDRAIIVMRRLLLDAIATVDAGGDPPATDESYYKIRAIERLLAPGSDWWAELGDEILGGAPREAAVPLAV
jgi:phthalate 4,5-dioxygenase oxygenase subunit